MPSRQRSRTPRSSRRPSRAWPRLLRTWPANSGPWCRCSAASASTSSRRSGSSSTELLDRKSTRLNSSHVKISYAVFCLIPRTPSAPLFPYTTLFRSARGMSDAFEAAFEDAEKFEEAIEGLAPAAQDVAREFRALVPLFRRIGIDVQQAFWQQLDGTL